MSSSSGGSSAARLSVWSWPASAPTAVEILIADATSGAIDQIGADARLVRMDGELVWVHLTGSVIRPPAGEPYLAVFVEDITVARQARAEIQRLKRELQRSRRLASLGQLVGGIGHDFSNTPVLMDLGQMISDAAGLLTEVLGEHVPVVTRQAEGLWPVQADPGLLKQVIINIALNARDAMPGGGQVTIDVMNIDTDNLPADWQDVTDLAELLPGRYVAFRMADTGTGMDAATAERAFEPFFTTKAATWRRDRVETAANGHEALGLLADPELAARGTQGKPLGVPSGASA